MPVVNLALLRRHVDWVLNQAALPEPERRWNQALWAGFPAGYSEQVDDAGIKAARDHICDSHRCIAGNIVLEHGTLLIDNHGAYWARAEPDDSTDYVVTVGTQYVGVTAIARQAGRLLGLTEDEFYLFEANNDAVAIQSIAEQIAERAGEEL